MRNFRTNLERSLKKIVPSYTFWNHLKQYRSWAFYQINIILDYSIKLNVHKCFDQTEKQLSRSIIAEQFSFPFTKPVSVGDERYLTIALSLNVPFYPRKPLKHNV